MNWANEPWRKLYVHITGDFGQLSATARCLSSELIKYATDTGMVCKTRSKDPALAVALVVSPQPHELEAFQGAAQELIDDEFLCVRDGAVWMRNFIPAQEKRSGVALRVQQHRERKKRVHEAARKESEEHDVTEHVTDDVTPIVTPIGNGGVRACNEETIRNETKRNETSVNNAREAWEDPERQKRVKHTMGCWSQAKLPPNGNAFEMGALSDEIHAAAEAAKEFGEQIPSELAICAELKRIAERQQKDKLNPSWRPSKLAAFVGQAIMAIREKSGSSLPHDFARALAKARGD